MIIRRNLHKIGSLQNQKFGSLDRKKIWEQPEFTGVNADFEQILDEPSGAKTMVLQEIYFPSCYKYNVMKGNQ